MSSATGVDVTKVAPAQLDFLAVYNPNFGDTDETAYDQIFFYYSREDWDRQHRSRSYDNKNAAGRKEDNEEEKQNRRLRQVGLARGMVEFAK